MNRRTTLKTLSAATGGVLLPHLGPSQNPAAKATFRFCLNTSTISGQQVGLLSMIDIAAKAGYEGVKLWFGECWYKPSNACLDDSLTIGLFVRPVRVK